MAVTEKFNRYYTDQNWRPKRIIYVSMSSKSSKFLAQSYQQPITIKSAIQNLKAGDLIFIKRTNSAAENINIKLDEDHSGNILNPVVFYGERNPDGSLGVHFKCASRGSNANSSCFNLEASHYIAIDGFKLEGGSYGVRSVGAGYEKEKHQNGSLLVNNIAFNQYKDPLFSAQSDWLVAESNTVFGAQKGDGHGIYLSNGSDWNIVRYNEIYNNVSSDFQVNADPVSTCKEAGIAYSSKACNGSARENMGQGVSEFFTISHNFMHDGLGQGPNFTSLRHSIINNNIFGPYSKHNTSFWQETTEPLLGSSNNKFSNNLLIAMRSHILQFLAHSNQNIINNNIFLSLNINANLINSRLQVIETDATTQDNRYVNNTYYTGPDIGHILDKSETLYRSLPNALLNSQYVPARTGHPEDWKITSHKKLNWQPPILHAFPSSFKTLLPIKAEVE